MKLLRNSVLGLVALLATASMALAGSVPFLSGPYDPGNALGTLNSLITSINGVLASSQNGFFLYNSTVAAAGSTVTDATPLNQGFNLVTAADATKGVVLPTAPLTTDVICVKNNASAVLKVWPDAAATINAIGSHVDIAMAANTMACFFSSSATQWWTLPLLPS